MPERASGDRWRWGVALALLVSAGVLWQHGPTLSYGFVYDDYHFVRPVDRAELATVWRGSWDIHAIESPFYRPLTIAFYAARFHLLRYDAQAYHALSLALFAMAGLIGAWIAARVTRSFAAACWFSAFWIVYPNLSVSLVAWLTNQMHLLQTIVCLTAFAVWWAVKERPAIWWMPLLALQGAAFLIKEDGVMLLPAIVGAHLLYRTMVARAPSSPGGRRGPPLLFAVAAIVLLAALLFIRHAALGELGGYGGPITRERLWRNFATGLERALLLRPARGLLPEWQAWFAACVLPLGALAAWFRDRALAFLIGCGLLIAVAFNLPFALVTKPEQYYLVSTGAIFALAAAVTALMRVARPWLPPLVMLATLVTLAGMHEASRTLAAEFAPASVRTRRTDAIVTGWRAVPEEIRTWLPVKLIEPNTGDLARDLSCVTFGLHASEKDFYHRPYRWTGGHVQIFARATASAVTFSLQPLFLEQPRRPFVVRIAVEGRLMTEQRLETENEGAFVIPLPPPERGSARMRLVELEVDHTWTPGRGDDRDLGVKMYDLSCRERRVSGAPASLTR